MNKSFDPLLKHRTFLNFIFDCSVGSAIIGSEKGNPLIKGLLDMYDRTVIVPGGKSKDGKVFEEGANGELLVHGYATSNYYYTYYILKHYPNFKLGNTYQDMGDFVIYPKELFEIGTFTGRHYAIHLNAGEWRTKEDDSDSLKNKIKNSLKGNEFIYDKIQVMVRKRRYKRLNRNIPFYAYAQAQKEGRELPEL